MENEAGIHLWDEPSDRGGDVPWQDTIDLLRLVQGDYEGARKQLEKVSQTLADREAIVNERLQYALLQSSGCRTLCLVPYRVGVSSFLGKAVLGEVARPRTLPKTAYLEVRCLGRFEISYQGNTVTRWQSIKAKSVFQYLMTQPREPVIKDVLMEALWPDHDPQAASNNLKAAVHGLRQTLSQLFDKRDAAAHVLFVQGSYLINREIELRVDVEQFEQHWVTGRRLEKEGKLSEAIHEFELAQALYRGDYLQDEPYEEWTLLRREALKDTYVTTLTKLADYAMDSADYEGCIIYCQKILVKDSCREDAYRQLMRCYSRLEQRNRGLRWYEICRRTLKAELDTDPDHDTDALYQSLLRNERI
jgi:DNA-binding SARP family transcriptional activator